MKIFSKDLLINDYSDTYYFIKNGQITSQTGGFTKELLAASAEIELTQYSDCLGVRVDLWGDNLWYTNNAVDFTKYTKLCMEVEIPTTTSQYCHFRLRKAYSSSDTDNLYDFVNGAVQTSKTTLTYTLPSTIPSTMNKLYFDIQNTRYEIKIYNMWLE